MEKTKKLPTLALSTLMMMTLGNLGTSMAFQLQSANMARIFQTLGADPTRLGFFFILPPLAGMIVQPLVGYYSDRTWIPRLGRRLPYLMLGTIVAVIVMCLLPNAGSLGLSTSAALWFGAIAILFMDLSSNMSMQPFKMMISDMVNIAQKDTAWSWQTIWSNIGGVFATILPTILTIIGIKNTASKGIVPDSVILSFYIGALILIVTSIFTICNVHEYDPITYAQYHKLANKKSEVHGLINILKKAPKVFWTLGIVQFCSWVSFQYLWTYGPGTIAQNIWHTANAKSEAFQLAGNWYGILLGIQTIIAILWGFVLVKINDKTRKPMYILGLIVGALGYFVLANAHTKLGSIIAFICIGIAWVTINAIPFTILTNALSGSNIGVYMGLFNSWICLPQVVASVASFVLYPLLNKYMPNMIMISGIVSLIGAASVLIIKETYGEKK